MKHIITTTLLLLALLLPTHAHAHQFSVDGIYYNIINSNEAEVTYQGSSISQYSNEYSGSVTIPATVTNNGTTYSVTTIGYGAFYGCSKLTTINIPNSVTNIGNSAFSYCSSLTNINIPSSVTDISSYAFSDCTSLTTINIPNFVTKIGSSAFSGCSSLTTVNIPNSVTTIGHNAFSYCSSLTNINIPNSVTSIGNWAFTDCSSLTTVNIPNSVTSIGEYAFSDCSRLTTINIPNSVTTIGRSAFSGTAWFNKQPDGLVYAGLVAYKYKGTLPQGTSITIKDGTKGIAGGAFSYCSGLTNINFPNSVTSIGEYAFSRCSSLTSINIPNSVTNIGYYAFQDCSSLTTITIPNSVTNIGEGAFYSTAWFDNQPDGVVYAGLVAYKYKGTMPQGTSITLKEGTKGIADDAFYGCSSLTNINIPNSVTNIGNDAFSDCSSLTTINIPNSVTTIGGGAFYGCSKLTTINIGYSVINIYGGAFEDCYSLNNVYCYATTPPECIDYGGYPFFSDYSATLHVPATSLAAYFTAPEWSKFENIVGDAIEPTGITISRDSVEIQSGEQFELTATVTPANASCKEVIWYSTDTSIATVEDGVVTVIGYGECDIFAYCMGMPAVCHITVANRISLGQQEAMLLPNHMLTLTPSAPTMPSGFTATSSDPTVAAVRLMSGKVQIVGIKEGTTTITVASTDGTAQPATCLVTVYTEPCDVNCDGFITIGDATQMIDYLLGGAVDNFKVANADVNGDGQISIGDVTILIDQLLSANN